MDKSEAKAQAMSEGCEPSKNPVGKVSTAQDCQPPVEVPSPAFLYQLPPGKDNLLWGLQTGL